MSVSDRDVFKDVRLGKFEATIRRMLLDKNPGRTDEFSMAICRLVGELDRPIKDEGVNAYELGLPGYVAFIKVDKRPTPQPIGDLTLAPGKPLVIRVTTSYLGEDITTVRLSEPGSLDNPWRAIR